MPLKPSFWSLGRAWYASGATSSHTFKEITRFGSTWPILYFMKVYYASEHLLSAEAAHTLIGTMSVLLNTQSAIQQVQSSLFNIWLIK